MNNTKTRTLARVTVLIAATLVVGMTFAATTTQSAFAYQMKGAGQDARCESIQKGWLLRKLIWFAEQRLHDNVAFSKHNNDNNNKVNVANYPTKKSRNRRSV